MVSDFQDENHLSRENELGRDLSDGIEAIRWQSSEEDLGLSVQETAAEVENTHSPEASEMLNDENEASEMFNDENAGSQLLSLGASLSGDGEADEVRGRVVWLGLGMCFLCKCQDLIFFAFCVLIFRMMKGMI